MKTNKTKFSLESSIDKNGVITTKFIGLPTNLYNQPVVFKAFCELVADSFMNTIRDLDDTIENYKLPKKDEYLPSTDEIEKENHDA